MQIDFNPFCLCGQLKSLVFCIYIYIYKRLFQTQGPYVTYRNFLHTMLNSKLAKETINKI